MSANDWYSIWIRITFQFSPQLSAQIVSIFCRFLSTIVLNFISYHIQTMPSTRSRTSTEAPEVAVEDKKTEVTEQQPENESEVKETPTEDKAEESNSAEQSSDSTSADEKPVDKSEDNTNGSTTTTDALPSDTNGDQSDEKPENGSAKRKSTADEAGDAPDSTDITPKKVKVDDESNGTKDSGAGDETDKQTAVETTA